METYSVPFCAQFPSDPEPYTAVMLSAFVGALLSGAGAGLESGSIPESSDHITGYACGLVLPSENLMASHLQVVMHLVPAFPVHGMSHRSIVMVLEQEHAQARMDQALKRNIASNVSTPVVMFGCIAGEAAKFVFGEAGGLVFGEAAAPVSGEAGGLVVWVGETAVPTIARINHYTTTVMPQALE